MENKAEKNLKINKYLLILFMETLLFLPYLFRGPVGSDSSDDMAMNLIASGAFGSGSQYLVYSSILYGYFLKGLYFILPGINWYLTAQFILNFAAVTSILLSLATFLSEKKALTAAVLLHFYFALEFYEKQQFSQNASLYALAGFVLFFTALARQEYAKKCRIAGVVMLLLSALVRFECLLLMLPFGGLFLLAAVLRDPQISEQKGLKEKFLECRKKWRTLLITLFASIFLCLGIFLLDQLVFWQKPEWKAYKEYHWDGIIPLLDVDGAPEFDPDALSAADITPEDIYLLYLYQYADMDYFSVEKLKTLAECRTATGAPSFGDSLLSSLKELYSLPKHYNDEVTEPSGFNRIFSLLESVAGWNLLFMLLFLIPLIRCKEKRKILLIFFALFCALFLAETFFLLLRGHAPRRVLLGSRCATELFTAFLVFSSVSQTLHTEENTRSRLLPALLLLLLFTEVLSQRLAWHAMLPDRSLMKMDLDTLRAIPGVHYLLDGNFLWAERLGISDPRSLNKTDYEDYLSPFILSGGWLAECPHNLHYREDGIKDPVLEMIGNERISYIVREQNADYCEAWMCSHLSKRSGREIKADIVYSSDDVRILRFK